MAHSEPASIFDFEVEDIEGKPVAVRSLTEGKVTLIVNVASQCGFTPQYEGLQELYERFSERGFQILAFPCNQFGGQEPGDNSQIKDFACGRFHVTFPMMSKITVNGASVHPLYEFLKRTQSGFLGTTGIKWNFTKFLCDRQGRPIARYAPTTKPADIASDVEKLLAEEVAAPTEGK